MLTMPNDMAGLRVIVNPVLTKAGTPYEAKRTWRERLLTRPWRPWQRTKTVVPQVPDPNVYRVGNSIVMHPVTYRAMKAEMDKLERGRDAGQRRNGGGGS